VSEFDAAKLLPQSTAPLSVALSTFVGGRHDA
jgi:hypothetical protein